LATGTGLAPFLSIVRDPETYEKFEQVVLIHGVREVKELAYREMLEHTLKQDEFLGEMVQQQFLYYPTVTREPFVHQGRIPVILDNAQVAKDLGLPELNPAEDRVMICGSPEMLRDLKALCEKRGFAEGNTTRPGQFVIERAFADS
ncbi:MAG: ferredoxin--NADP reductase, partial [Hydrogenophaga sp.]|nr:ferredoxin--NADP reductase [Hydrogenophaga sp.]